MEKAGIAKYLIILLLFFCIQSLSSQESFVKVILSKSYPMPPFVKEKITISNNYVFYRNELRPKNTMRESWKEKYDAVDTTTYSIQLNRSDFDTICSYVLNSGLLNIDMDYTKPVSRNGVVAHFTGGCGISYQIITAEKVLELPYTGAYEIKLPESLIEFNSLFHKIVGKYPKLNDNF